MIRRIPANESFKTVAGWGAGSKIHLVLCKLGWPFIPRKKNRNLEGSRSFCRFHPILGAIDNMDPFHPACLEPNDPPVQLLGPDWLEVQLNPNRSWTTTRDYMDSRRFVTVYFAGRYFPVTSGDLAINYTDGFAWWVALQHKVAATISPIDLRWFSSRWLTPSTRCSKSSTTANNEHLRIKYLSPKVGKIQVNQDLYDIVIT